MTNIKNVTVAGAGVLGTQIAYQSAFAGFNVTSWDISDDALEEAKKRFDRLDANYLRDVEGTTEEDTKAAQSRLTLTSDLEEAVKDADLIIEAVPEKLDIKKDFWGKVAKAAPEKTIFTTNTSTLLPSDFRDATGRPEKFLAFHFANRLWNFRIAEVMPHDGTDEEATNTVFEYAKEMQMDPMRLKREQPGYILNTLLVPLLEAAQTLWITDVADPEDIDKNWKTATGSPKGPFESMDVIGLRTVSTIALTKENENIKKFGEYVMENMVEKGKVGVESNEGFFRYDDDGNRIDDDK